MAESKVFLLFQKNTHNTPSNHKSFHLSTYEGFFNNVPSKIKKRSIFIHIFGMALYFPTKFKIRLVNASFKLPREFC